MFSISSYFSVEYLLMLLPACVFCYLILPKTARRFSLLLFSWAFFWAVSGKLIVYLLASIVLVYVFGLWLGSLLEKQKSALASCEKGKKKAIRARFQKKMLWVVVPGVLLHIGILLIVKYTPFFADNLNSLLRILHIPAAVKPLSLAAPIGISFYTLQAASYLIDVYHQKIPADRNILRVALYMSFFPQIMEGPICRYTDTASTLWEAPPIRWENFIRGSERILYGLMKKTVGADRLNLLIKNVFDGYAANGGYTAYDGFVIALAALCYTIQLYMDFSGTMDVVIGTGEIFGILMPENFKRPFFSRTISEFWTRWHITLGTWFKDYLFYPISMSKPMKRLTSRARKRFGNHYGPLFSGGIALLCVWFCNGLWHGSGWHYIVFGLYHFVLILTGSLILPLSIRLAEKLHISRDHWLYHFLQIFRTFVLVCFGELIFRAKSLGEAAGMLKKIGTAFTFASLKDGSLFTFGMNQKDYLILFVLLGLILVISLLQERGVKIREAIAGKGLVIHYLAIWALILFIIIFGAYGQGYLPVNPIYAEF